MQTGLKRAEQAQPSSPARSCRCYSREWEEEDPVARSPALCAEFQTPPSGAWEQGGHGGGAGSGGAAQCGCGPRTPGPRDPAEPLPGCPARQAAPIRPRAISVGRRAGIRAGPPPPALGKLSAPTASDRRTRATTLAPHRPARSAAQRSRPPLTATGSSEGSAPAATGGREGARA